MKKEEFQNLVDEKGFDVAIVEYYWELHNKGKGDKFASFLDMKEAAIRAIENCVSIIALEILQVLCNLPEGDSGYYCYDYKTNPHKCIPLTNISDVEALIGFEE